MNSFDLPEQELHYSNEAECAVIGSVLAKGPDAYDAASAMVTADDFYQPLHALLWAELQKMVLAGKHVDVITLMQEMRGADVDWGYVNGLAQNAEHLSRRAVARHSEIVKDYSQCRQFSSAARTAVELAADAATPLAERIGRAVSVLEAVVDGKEEEEARPIADFGAEFIDRLQAMAEGDLVPARATHIPTLDRMLSGGLRDEQLVIIAARPSVGKSSLAQQLALSSAREGIPAAFFGMEMTSRELTNRTVANVGRVSLSALKTGKLTDDDWSRTSEGVEALRTLPLFLLDKAAMTLADVASQARKLARKHKIKLLVIDYLQLMKGMGSKQRERRTELEEITRGCKQLAKQLGITVVLLSQLNRAVEQRTNPRPVMSDLKECGAIEEDADVILVLWPHRKDETGHGGDLKGCAVLKNRDGSTGELALHFEGQYQRWAESTESLHAPSKTEARTYSRGMD